MLNSPAVTVDKRRPPPQPTSAHAMRVDDDDASCSELSAIPESEGMETSNQNTVGGNLYGADEIMESTPRLSPHAHAPKLYLPSGRSRFS